MKTNVDVKKAEKPVRRRIRKPKQDYIITAVSYVVVTLFALCCLLPLINLFAKAVSSEKMVLSGEVGLWPKEFQLESVLFILNQSGFQTSFINSLFVTLVSMALAVVVTVCAAYPLSIRTFKGRRAIQFLLTFITVFSGGTIPGYILLRNLGLLESLWGLIFPALVVPFWVIIMRSGFETIPESISESARIDGANHFQTLFKVLLPLVKPQIATMVLMFSVDKWNEYCDALLILHKRENFTLQLYLQNMLTSFNQGSLVSASQLRQLENQASSSMQGAAIFLSILPVLFLYPFLQKYFVKGMTLGAVKG